MPNTQASALLKVLNDLELGIKPVNPPPPVHRWRGDDIEALRIRREPYKSLELQDVEGENTLLRELIHQLQRETPTDIDVLREVIRHNEVMSGIFESTTTKAKSPHAEHTAGRINTRDALAKARQKVYADELPEPEAFDEYEPYSIGLSYLPRYEEYTPQG